MSTATANGSAVNTNIIDEKRPKRGKGEPAIEVLETRHVEMSLIDADETWNGRRMYGTERHEEKGRGMTDEEMEQDFKDRIEKGEDPQLQPVRLLGPLPDGRFFLEFGFRRRRILAGLGRTTVWASIRKPTKDAREDRKRSYRDNIAENANRQSLRPWEQADQWCRFLDEFPEESAASLSRGTSLSKSHVTNLVRLKRKLCPELWDEYVKKGDSMKMKLLLKACVKPAEEQVEYYELLRKEEAGGRPVRAGEEEEAEAGGKPPKKGKSSGTGTDEGPFEVDWKVIESWLKEAAAACSKDAGEFAEGAEYALKCVLDMEPWDHKRLYEEDGE